MRPLQAIKCAGSIAEWVVDDKGHVDKAVNVPYNNSTEDSIMRTLALFPLAECYIFDKDGTILDTESVWHEAISRLLKSYGYQYDLATQHAMMGIAADGCARMLQQAYRRLPQAKNQAADLVSEMRRLFQVVRDERGLHPMPGAREFLDGCRDRGIRIALATSAGREITFSHLTEAGWIERFEVIVTGDDVRQPKPHPDVFAQAARRMSVDPDRCLAFEDSLNGLQSAVFAGMPVVHVADERFDFPVSKLASLRAASFTELLGERDSG